MTATLVPSQAVVEHVSTLIGFDTVSRNSNLQLIDCAAGLLESGGAVVRRDFNHDRSKANLIATFGQGADGIVLSGHSDVVPVDGQRWSSDPFRAQVRDGRLYGRGACDMKGFIGVVLAQAATLKGRTLREPVHIALSHDEEAGCLGIPGLLAHMHAAGIRPCGCVVGEPTSMEVVSAHKGGRIYSCRVTGCAAHSSLTPKGVNAIEYASRLITHIQDLAEAESSQGQRIESFDVPFSTISTNTISGGNGRNIIPAHCDFSFEYRYLPGADPDRFIQSVERYARDVVVPKMQARHPSADIEFQCDGNIPALDSDANEALQALARELLGSDISGHVAYGTEASFFQQMGTPASSVARVRSNRHTRLMNMCRSSSWRCASGSSLVYLIPSRPEGWRCPLAGASVRLPFLQRNEWACVWNPQASGAPKMAVPQPRQAPWSRWCTPIFGVALIWANGVPVIACSIMRSPTNLAVRVCLSGKRC
ncbi:acetylornithine deacetylase [Pseudomonas baltica]|uniref:acetylornithine deacetylase n=1 Tax=Pseudomonas baltica TaxID=2762576 RepID=UPI00289C454A|nr:acetylornithine deacetylase [Pseudomonas baltica]